MLKMIRAVMVIGVILLSIGLTSMQDYADQESKQDVQAEIQRLEEEKSALISKIESAQSLIESAKNLGYKDNSDILVDTREMLETCNNEVSAIEIVIDSLKLQDVKQKEETKLLENINKQKVAQEEQEKKNLTFDAFTISNLNENDFNKILTGTNLAGQGKYFEYIEKENGVNGLFAIGVATKESSAGKHNANTNNFWGRKATADTYLSWGTPGESIQSFGKYMSTDRYYGKTIDEISVIYCPPNHLDWSASVKQIMQSSWNKVNNP